MAEKVEIDIVATDKTKPAISSALKNFAQLREMGEKISQVGMRMSAAFTAPVVALTALVLKNEEVQKSLEPIKKAFSDISVQLAQAFIPVIKDITPAILQIADAIKQAVTWFANLDVGTKELIIKIALFGAMLGPILVLIGQLIGTIGTVGMLVNQLSPVFAANAVAVWAMVGPWVALAAAVYAVIKLAQMEEFKQAVSLLGGGFVGAITGDNTKRALATQKTYAALGGGGDPSTGAMIRGLVSAPSSAPSGGTVVINYQPMISTADQQQAVTALQPIIQQALRTQAGR